MGKGIRAIRGSAAGEHGAAVQAWAERRWRYLDNLKSSWWPRSSPATHRRLRGGGLWPYSEIREETLADATTIGLLALVGPFALFLIPLLFLVSGCGARR